jgi:hypothetical protein
LAVHGCPSDRNSGPGQTARWGYLPKTSLLLPGPAITIRGQFVSSGCKTAENVFSAAKPAQHDRCCKRTERKFSWENVEIKKIKDGKNKLKRVPPMPLAKQENAHAKPQHAIPKLADIAAFGIYYQFDLVSRAFIALHVNPVTPIG